MFVAWRDLSVARGRFALIGVVVALITVLVTFLTGLTGGLAQQNISAITSLPADRIVFSMPAGKDPSYADSRVTSAQAATWSRQEGVTSVEPLGISTGKLVVDDRQETVALFGGSGAPARGHVRMSPSTAAALGVHASDRVDVGGRSMVLDVASSDSYYSHLPVAHVDLDDWQQLSMRPGEQAPYATVLAVSAEDADHAAADRAAATSSKGLIASLTALGSFKSEIGSLLLMVAMLFGISALVVGAFFAVWSIQRQPDVAVLKALGATNRMLTLDALGQAVVLLLAGVGVGIGVTAVLGLFLGTALPFVLSPLTTALPGLVLTVLGLAGAGAATRSITHTDPLTALGSNR